MNSCDEKRELCGKASKGVGSEFNANSAAARAPEIGLTRRHTL
jgi:hypothetical protein